MQNCSKLHRHKTYGSQQLKEINLRLPIFFSLPIRFEALKTINIKDTDQTRGIRILTNGLVDFIHQPQQKKKSQQKQNKASSSSELKEHRSPVVNYVQNHINIILSRSLPIEQTGIYCLRQTVSAHCCSSWVKAPFNYFFGGNHYPFAKSIFQSNRITPEFKMISSTTA